MATITDARRKIKYTPNRWVAQVNCTDGNWHDDTSYEYITVQYPNAPYTQTEALTLVTADVNVWLGKIGDSCPWDPEPPPPPPPVPPEPPPPEPPEPPPHEEYTLEWFIAIFGVFMGRIIYEQYQQADHDIVERTAEQIVQTYYTIYEWWLEENPKVVEWMATLDDAVRLAYMEDMIKFAETFDNKLGVLGLEFYNKILPIEEWQDIAFTNITEWWQEKQRPIVDYIDEREGVLREDINVWGGTISLFVDGVREDLTTEIDLLKVQPPPWYEVALGELLEAVIALFSSQAEGLLNDVNKGLNDELDVIGTEES